MSAAQAKEHGESDASKQAFVIESSHTKLRFEADGTGSKVVDARIRIQSEAAVEAFGLLRMGYNTAFEKFEVEYVRVVKPDGTKVTADTGAIQDLPGEIQRVAPQYTDFREKHINVPGLRPGDVLEYSFVTNIFAAMVPGHFFVDYTFQKKAITRDEELEINVPSDKPLKTKFAKGLEPTMNSEGGRKIYSWHRANSAIEDEETKDDDETTSADVQMSTFQSWTEVAKWYADLERGRLEPNEAIRIKSAELTKGLTSEEQKIEAIYNYVATNVRYLGLSFGAGRYQPHTAAEVLANEYGDCKDKVTLTASLLSAAGIKSDAVLIHSSQKLDEDVPSPMQFNHLIGVVMTDKGDEYLDTTAEVAPRGYLLKVLRGKWGLRVKPTGEGVLVKTPADSPYPDKERTEIKAALNDQGDLEGDVVHTAQGDPAIVWRALLRRAAEAQWDQMMKAVLATADIKAEVSKIEIAPIADLEKPIRVKYHFLQKQYVDWSKHDDQLKLPMISINVQPAATPEQRKDPIRIGKQEMTIKLDLRLPDGTIALTPSVTNKTEEFAEYHASYAFEKQMLTAERTFRMKVDEMPRKRYQDYNEVYERITADEDQKATLVKTAVNAKTHEPSKVTVQKTNASADELVRDAKSAMQARDIDQAQRVLERAVKQDPKDAEAWSLLGRVYSMRRFLDKSYGDKAVDAYRRQVELSPKDREGWKQLGMACLMQGEYSDAADAVTKQIELTPDDQSLNWWLGTLLVMGGRPKDAIGPLEKAVSSGQADSNAQLMLAKSYYLTGEKQKGDELTKSMLDGEMAPQQRASIAEMLADVKASPDLAEQQIQMALSDAYSKLEKVDIKLADEPELQRAWKMAKIWEGAGWIYFQHGNVPRGQLYLEAAWSWLPQVTNGDRLAQVYLKQGRKDDAIRIWAQAMSTQTVEHPEVRKHFVEVVGDERAADRLITQHRLDLQDLRTLDVENPQKISGNAEFYIQIGPGSKIEDVNRYEGDEKVNALSSHLKKARLELPMPDEQPIHLLRTGILSCFSMSPTCKFVLTPAPTVMKMDPKF